MKEKLPKKVKKTLKHEKPRNSKRYCMYCRKMRKFQYDPMVFHSACIVCGGRMARRRKPKYMKKCPICNSTRITVHGKTFHCKKCGYLNKEFIK